MHWQSHAIVLNQSSFGENSRIITLFTQDHGLARGLLRPKRGCVLQCGSVVQSEWRARLAEHLGHLTLENIAQPWAAVMDDSLRLLLLRALCDLLRAVLPEHHPYPPLYDEVRNLIMHLEHKNILAHYARFEVQLLQTLGYGLQLERCAVTKQKHDLCFVSPKSGEAVCRSVAAPYESRLLPLPAFLRADNDEEVDAREVYQALELTGFFIARHILNAPKTLPPSRGALMQAVQRFCQMTSMAHSVTGVCV